MKTEYLDAGRVRNGYGKPLRMQYGDVCLRHRICMCHCDHHQSDMHWKLMRRFLWIIAMKYSTDSLEHRLANDHPEYKIAHKQIELKTTKNHKKIKISIFIGIVITWYFTLHFFVCYIHSVELWAIRFAGFYQVFDIIAIWITHCFPRNIEMCPSACSNDDSVMPHGKPETTQRTTTFWSQQLIANWVLIHWFYPINSTPTQSHTFESIKWFTEKKNFFDHKLRPTLWLHMSKKRLSMRNLCAPWTYRDVKPVTRT